MLSFPKSARLLKSYEFHKVRQKGTFLLGHYLAVNVLYVEGDQNKLGISVPKQYGKAHDRNKFKRYIREVFRQTKVSSSLHIHIKPRSLAKEANYQQLKLEYSQLLEKIVT